MFSRNRKPHCSLAINSLNCLAPLPSPFPHHLYQAFIDQLLHNHQPRTVGETPRFMGLYERLAPGPQYDKIEKMKRSAVKAPTGGKAAHRRNFVPVV